MTKYFKRMFDKMGQEMKRSSFKSNNDQVGMIEAVSAIVDGEISIQGDNYDDRIKRNIKVKSKTN